MARLDGLGEKISRMEEAVTRRVRDDVVPRAAFDALHAELQQYRNEALREAQKPILKGLLLIYDRVEQAARAAGSEALGTLEEEIVELLRRHDVELIGDRPDRFDNRIQRAVRTEEARAAEEDQRVTQVVRQGFRWGGRILRPQEVVVRVFKGEGAGAP